LKLKNNMFFANIKLALIVMLIKLNHTLFSVVLSFFRVLGLLGKKSKKSRNSHFLDFFYITYRKSPKCQLFQKKKIFLQKLS